PKAVRIGSVLKPERKLLNCQSGLAIRLRFILATVVEMWSLAVPKNSISNRLHERKPYTAPQFEHLTLEEANAKLASTALAAADVKQLLEWIRQLENRQHEEK